MDTLTESDVKSALDECVCFHFRKTTRAVTAYFDQALSPSNIRSGQLVILLSIRGGSSPTRNELAERVGLDQSALSRGLQALERQKLVKTVAGKDKRTRLVSLTAKGQKKLVEVFPLWEAAQRAFNKELGTKHIRAILHDLDLVYDQVRLMIDRNGSD